MQIAIDFSGLQRLQANMQRSPEIVREELLRAITEADLLLAREVAEATPVGAGGASGLKGSEFHVERVAGLGVEGFVGSSSDHVVPVELGTRPHFPPITPLVDWVMAKLHVKDEKAARGIAFAIARKISVRGTRGAFMFEKSFARLEAKVRSIFETAQDRIAARLLGT